jgi:hypothetical protein
MKIERKNFNKGIKLHLLCDKADWIRPFKKHIYFKDGYAYASEGHIIIKAYLPEISSFNEDEIKIMDGKFLHADNYKLLIGYDTVRVTDAGFEVEKNDCHILIRFEDNIVPMPYKEDWEKLPSESKCNIPIDSSLLDRLSKAMNAPRIIIYFRSSYLGPCKVKFMKGACEYEKTIGLIMPLYIGE